jgi:hypothetical protein
MGTPRLWSSVSVSMESALASAKTIATLSKANPGVANSTAHGYSVGDYLLLAVTGMTQVNNRVFRMATAATPADNWSLEGEDTTLYDTFAAGTSKKITFGTVLSTLTDVNASGGEPEEKDATTIHQDTRSILLGVFTPLKLSFQSYWDPGDSGLAALTAASKSKAFKCFHIAWPDGRRALFYGQVAASGVPTGGAQDLVKTGVTITASGAGTYYST